MEASLFDRVLYDRYSQNYIPGRDDDGHDVQLAVCGGGVKPDVTGMLHVLHTEGLVPYFNGGGGTSAGGAQLCGVFAGMQHVNEEIMLQIVPNENIVDVTRILPGSDAPIFDINRVIHAMFVRHQLDVKRLKDGPRNLSFSITDLSTLGSKVLDIHDIPDEDIRKRFKQSMFVPWVAGTPETDTDGIRWVDGGIGKDYLTTLQQLLSTRPNPDQTLVMNLVNGSDKDPVRNRLAVDLTSRWIGLFGTAEASRIFKDEFSVNQVAHIRQMRATPNERHKHVYSIHPETRGLQKVKTGIESVLSFMDIRPATVKRGYLAGQEGMVHALQPFYRLRTPHLANQVVMPLSDTPRPANAPMIPLFPQQPNIGFYPM